MENVPDRNKSLFKKLLDDPSMLPEDKIKIKEVLKKPWNAYIRRHSALTDKSRILKEHVLRQHAGWSVGSNMPQVYLHYFGNESSESLLEATDTKSRRGGPEAYYISHHPACYVVYVPLEF